MDRFSEYRVMWVLVLFDLPTEQIRIKKTMLFPMKNPAQWQDFSF